MVFTDHIRIDPAYRDALQTCGLTRVEDILKRVDGRVFAWSRTTDTVYVPCPGGRPGFYLKRYHYPRWRGRLRGTFRGRFFGVHRGLAEYRSLNAMRMLGIPAVRPVAFGARRLAHFVAACFLVTEEVPGAHNLTSFARNVQTGRAEISRAYRHAMVERLAVQVAAMHSAGFEHGQLFWRNVLIRKGPDDLPEFFFLDAQPPRRVFPRSTGRWWLTELAHLAASAIPFATRSERLRFLLRYSGVRRMERQTRQDIREMEKTATRWRRHETQRIKMNDLFEEWNRQLDRENGAAPLGGSAAQLESSTPATSGKVLGSTP